MIALNGSKRFVLRVNDRPIASSNRCRELEAYLALAITGLCLIPLVIVDRWTGGVLLRREVVE